MRLRELAYGPSPGAPLRASNCGYTDTHIPATRKKFFQELAAGHHQETYVRTGIQ